MKQAFCSWSSEGEEHITNMKNQYSTQANIGASSPQCSNSYHISASLWDEEMDVCCFCTLFFCIYDAKKTKV